MISRQFTSKLIAETIGTFAIVFAGCGAIMVAERFPGSMPAGFIPIIFGLSVAVMIYTFGHISGAHFNPAVTIAFSSAGHFPKREVPGYCIGQCAGSLLAIGLLKLLLPAGNSFGSTVPHIQTWQALGWEITLSFFLMLVIIAVATDARAVGTMAGCAIGATVTIAALIGGPLTGASMNPARSLAPAIAESRLAEMWVYLLGPIVGAFLASQLYGFVRCNVPETTKAGGCC